MARMNHPRYRYYSFFPSLILLALPNAIVQNDQVSQMNIFEKARDLSDIKAKGMPGFLLREEVVFPGYSRSRIGNGTQYWQVRSIEGEFPSIFELHKLFDSSRAPRIQEG